MFDHSEHLNNSTVVKILTLTEGPTLNDESRNNLELAAFNQNLKELGEMFGTPQDPEELVPDANFPADSASGVECVGCQIDPSEYQSYANSITDEERAWVEREVFRFMQDTRPTTELTPEQLEEYTGLILIKMQQLIKFVIVNRVPTTE